MKEKEFGYPVSSDYEKLWLMLQKFNYVFGFCDLSRIEGRVSVSLDSTSAGKSICVHEAIYGTTTAYDKKRLMNFAISHNLTFIDPEPADQNAIMKIKGQYGDTDDTWLLCESCGEDVILRNSDINFCPYCGTAVNVERE